MGFCDGMLDDGFFEGRWNGKAIPIMNELVQMVGAMAHSVDSLDFNAVEQ